jgi:hypothetical protein
MQVCQVNTLLTLLNGSLKALKDGGKSVSQWHAAWFRHPPHKTYVTLLQDRCILNQECEHLKAQQLN